MPPERVKLLCVAAKDLQSLVRDLTAHPEIVERLQRPMTILLTEIAIQGGLKVTAVDDPPPPPDTGG